jgi:hypothetical protein
MEDDMKSETRIIKDAILRHKKRQAEYARAWGVNKKTAPPPHIYTIQNDIVKESRKLNPDRYFRWNREASNLSRKLLKRLVKKLKNNSNKKKNYNRKAMHRRAKGKNEVTRRL